MNYELVITGTGPTRSEYVAVSSQTAAIMEGHRLASLKADAGDLCQVFQVLPLTRHRIRRIAEFTQAARPAAVTW